MRYKLAAIIFFATVQAPALAVQSFTVTREDLALMPPYCTAIYGHLVGLPRFEESPLRNTHPPGCFDVHHYCDALKAMVRVNRNAGRDLNESSFWLTTALASFQNVIEVWEKSAPNCALRAEGHTNLGKALLRKGSAGTAVLNFNKALELQPTFLPAYYALSDYHFDSGKKREALAVIEQALKYRPDSKVLVKRFKELGGTTLPEPIAKPAAEPQQQEAAQPADDKPTTGAAPASSAPTDAEPPKPQSYKNPYCRFCAE